MTRMVECIGGKLTDGERQALEINEDVRESDKVVSEALLTEKDLKGVSSRKGMTQVKLIEVIHLSRKYTGTLGNYR